MNEAVCNYSYTKETSAVCISAADAHLMHLTIRVSVYGKALQISAKKNTNYLR